MAKRTTLFTLIAGQHLVTHTRPWSGVPGSVHALVVHNVNVRYHSGTGILYDTR